MSQPKYPQSMRPATSHNTDHATQNRIRELLSNPRERITENDIRNVKTDASLFNQGKENFINDPKGILPNGMGDNFENNKKTLIKDIEPNIELVWNISDK